MIEFGSAVTVKLYGGQRSSLPTNPSPVEANIKGAFSNAAVNLASVTLRPRYNEAAGAREDRELTHSNHERAISVRET